jgi:hypothetical protein
VSSDDIDRVLSNEDSILPSSGFAASVMEAVRRDAETLPPIPFPWKRALPGLVSCVGALIALLVLVFSRLGRGTALPDGMVRAVQATGWIAAAAVVSLVSVIVGTRGLSRVFPSRRG